MWDRIILYIQMYPEVVLVSVLCALGIVVLHLILTWMVSHWRL